MQKTYKDNIKQHFPLLVDSIDSETLAIHLFRKRIIKKGDLNKILADKRDNKHNNRLLLFQILKKNDQAYQELVKYSENIGLRNVFVQGNTKSSHITVFKQEDQNTPDEELDLSRVQLNSPVDRNDRATTISVSNPNVKPLEVKVKLSTQFSNYNLDNTYNTTTSNRGRVLIINNKEFLSHSLREGSEQDVKALESLFKQMFFKVETHSDLLVNEMKTVIREFAKYEQDKAADICVVIIMSHGAEKQKELAVIDRVDNSLPTAWVEGEFTNVKCGQLSGKPKIFLYQLCRGLQDDYAITSSQKINRNPSLDQPQYDKGSSVQTDSGDMIQPFERRLEDMLVGYATQKGYKAHRDLTRGSWYIQLICEVFMEKAHNTEIKTMLNEVDRKLQRIASPGYTMQTSSYTSNGFNKNLFFNPGIYLDDHGNMQKFE